MDIKLGNIKTFKPDGSTTVFIDRRSVLGNPYPMERESERNLVCDWYEEYLVNKIRENDEPICRELTRIIELTKKGPVTVLCWCYPLRCHGETIIKYLKILESGGTV